MNVPIRVLGIATSIFWIILLVVIASAVYSLKDLTLDIGEPYYVTTLNKEMVVTLPFSIGNGGSYSLNGFNLTTVFSSAEGAEISRATTSLPVLMQGQSVQILHNASLNIDSIAERDSKYIVDDVDLTCTLIAGLNFAELLPTQLAANVTFPWGAPFYNLELGTPSFAGGNLSHTTARVPLSYENHAAFDVTGSFRVRLYSADGALLAETEKAVNSPRNTWYDGDLYFPVPSALAASNASSRGHFEVYFSTSMFDGGPVVIPYG
jgi:hypothetical protein